MTPRAWLRDHPLRASEQLFAVVSNASGAGPLSAWKRSMTTPASPIWAGTPYAEWESVMPYVGLVTPDSEFLDWIATTDALDWGWLAVSSASQQRVAEHLCGLTQVLLPDAKAVFFRFWDGRFVRPILQSAHVDAAVLLPVLSRCLINGQPLALQGNARCEARAFPWWTVPEALLRSLADGSSDCLLDNLLRWLDEAHPDLFEQVDERILRRKVAHFLKAPGQPLKAALLQFLALELGDRPLGCEP
ncbi:hypothetical protein VM99_05665 [Pseudomonas chlororaphis]|uniref:DUF4123 domain-containing protein n=1 Tax=Pseudomonas chlororaphis TaxID=587753 RepID=A0A0G3GFK3_9PSED|nr:DUF4123 domain-containing protein [Pseudomonas sp. P97.38]AKJ97566.1 hypothetical protein VM99_05665 [Pseudomonas chlororaphis]